MSLSIIANVLFCYYDIFSLLITCFLAHFFWQWHLPFKTRYLPVSLLKSNLPFEVVIILIFKHASVLCLSGTSATSALTQAALDYQDANIMSTIVQHFPASYQEYTTEQFTVFLMGSHIGLWWCLISTKMIADITFRVICVIGVRNTHMLALLPYFPWWIFNFDLFS